MLINERHQRIIDIVRENGTISTLKLSERLFVSPATIRRDLTFLSERGLIKRKHGYVQSIYKSQVEFTNLLRAQVQVPEKKKIAEKCSEFLRDEFTYFLDSSTTVEYLIPYFSKLSNITVITNGLETASKLSYFTQFHLFMAGGAISFSTNSTVGSDTVDHIKRFNSNIFIFSCRALSLSGGIMEANFEQMRTKTAMLENSKKHILLVDHTKFNQFSSFKTCDFSLIDILITDQMPPREYVDFFEKNNVKLIIA